MSVRRAFITGLVRLFDTLLELLAKVLIIVIALMLWQWLTHGYYQKPPWRAYTVQAAR